MKNDDEIQGISELLESLFSDILGGKAREVDILGKGWKKVLRHIPIDGEKLAAHSRIIELKNRLLCLETDHPGWIQLFYLHRKKIIYGLKKEFPELEVNDFSFVLKGQKIEKRAGLRDITVKEHEEYLEKKEYKNN